MITLIAPDVKPTPGAARTRGQRIAALPRADTSPEDHRPHITNARGFDNFSPARRHHLGRVRLAVRVRMALDNVGVNDKIGNKTEGSDV